MILVACQGREDDRSLQIIDDAHRTAPDVPIIVLSTSSPNGFLRRAFESGAADMALFPQSKEQLRFAMSKAIARAPRRGGATRGERGDGRLICVLGPKGGTGKTLTSHQPRRRARAGRSEGARHRPRPPVRRRRALPRRYLPRRRCTTSRSRAARSTRTSSHDYVMTHDTGVDVLLAPARPDQASAITIELLRDILVVARSTVRLRDRRHAAGLHGRGDRDDRRELRPRDGGNARLALAEEHEARPRDARAHGLRPEEDPARPEPRGHPGRASASTTSSPCSAASRTSSSRRIARSRAR